MAEEKPPTTRPNIHIIHGRKSKKRQREEEASPPSPVPSVAQFAARARDWIANFESGKNGTPLFGCIICSTVEDPAGAYAYVYTGQESLYLVGILNTVVHDILHSHSDS